jgi:hypothetical protein
MFKFSALNNSGLRKIRDIAWIEYMDYKPIESGNYKNNLLIRINFHDLLELLHRK